MPTVTVLMTVYNGEVFLKKAIEAILAQSFRDFEFLIVDDCSKDSSVAIIKSYKDDRIILHQNEKNIGQTRSLNLGLRLARGAFIARMDADDLAFPDWLKLQVEFLTKQDERCVLVSPKALIIDLEGKVSRTLNTPKSSLEIVIRSLWASPVNHVGTLMRRQAILDQGGYDEDFRIAADYALWSKLLCKGMTLSIISKSLIAIRSHAQSVTAVAAGKDDVAEVSRIMGENISHWSGVKLSKEELRLIWDWTYNVGVLGLEEMKAADDLFVKISQQLRGVEDSVRAVGMIKRQTKIVYMKKIFDLIRQKDVAGVRSIAFLYTQQHGFLSVFLLIWLFSFVSPLLLFIPSLYAGYRRFKAARSVT